MNKTLVNKKATGLIIDSYSYTYDRANNQTSKLDSKGVTHYAYDSLNRLVKTTEPSGKETSYTFDKAGNRLTETVKLGTSSVTTKYTYNEQNRLMSTVCQSGSQTVTDKYRYDNNGNTISKTSETVKPIDSALESKAAVFKAGQSPTGDNTSYDEITLYEFDVWNQLIKTTVKDKKISYSYNGEGYRVSKDINGQTTNYLYEADKVILETDGANNQIAKNIYGLNLLTRTAGNDTMNYMYNGHADVTALLNQEGTVTATYYYDAFGNIIEQTGNANNNITYAGYQYDGETGLYYLNARMYDPKIARFLQEDTYLGDRNDPLSLNLYTYCHNEPVMYTDPTGHFKVSQGDYNNSDVKIVQNLLIQCGYDIGKFGADGDFGNDTLQAVNQFKSDHKLTNNTANTKGIVGDTTLDFLIKEASKKQAQNNSSGYSYQGYSNKNEESKKNISDAQQRQGSGSNQKKEPVSNQSKNTNDAGKSKDFIQGVADTAIEGGNYVLGNAYDASLYISPYTQFGMDVYKLTSPLYWAFAYSTYKGWFPEAFDIAGFTRDEETGTYHAKQDGSVQSLKYVGYNNLYDGVFNCFTRMNKAKFQFSDDRKEYIFWAWKGDYLNLGAGAEMGIYSRLKVNDTPTEHWLIDKSLSMPMTLKVEDNKGNQIIDYKPSEKQWWVTGFNPSSQFYQASNLKATYTVDFSGKEGMYEAFIKSDDYLKNKRKWSISNDNKYLLTFTFK